MTLKRVAIAAGLVLAGFGSVLAEPSITIERKTDAISDDEVLRAIDTFREACQPLGKEYWPDVTSVIAEAFNEDAPYRLDLGWKHTIHLAIRFSDQPKHIPEFYDDIGVTVGHTLHYDLGAGNRTGFFAAKRVSQRLCGLPVDETGASVFKDDEGFSFLGQ